jgi:hypothetical protein
MSSGLDKGNSRKLAHLQSPRKPVAIMRLIGTYATRDAAVKRWSGNSSTVFKLSAGTHLAKNLAGALHTDGAGCTLIVSREMETINPS